MKKHGQRSKKRNICQKRRLGTLNINRLCGRYTSIRERKIIMEYTTMHHALTYLDLGPPVPLRASGDEKPPSITVTGDPSGSMPADTHLF